MDTYLQGRYLLELWWLPQAKHFPVAEPSSSQHIHTTTGYVFVKFYRRDLGL